MLNEPANVSEIGLDALENVNRAILEKIHADSGTHNINRILRVPGTFNFKIPENPRPVAVISDAGPTYDLDVFRVFMNFKPRPKANKPSVTAMPLVHSSNWDQEISSLPVSERIKNLIINGNDGTYTSRSEADMAVILALVSKGFSEADIRSIFASYPIGEKYREHNAPDDYLSHCIEKAKDFSNLNDVSF